MPSKLMVALPPPSLVWLCQHASKLEHDAIIAISAQGECSHAFYTLIMICKAAED